MNSLCFFVPSWDDFCNKMHKDQQSTHLKSGKFWPPTPQTTQKQSSKWTADIKPKSLFTREKCICVCVYIYTHTHRLFYPHNGILYINENLLSVSPCNNSKEFHKDNAAQKNACCSNDMKYEFYLMSSKTLVIQNSICYYCLIFGRKAVTNPDTIKKQRHYFAYKGPYSQSNGFSSSHIRMWLLYVVQNQRAKRYTEKWTPKSVGVQYATGEEGRNNSRKNEETMPKRKHHPAVDVTGDGGKVWSVKNNTA